MEPLRGVTAKMLKENGYPNMDYKTRKADLDQVLDMIITGISRKFNWTPAETAKNIKDIAAAANMKTTDVRALLLIDDWKSTAS